MEPIAPQPTVEISSPLTTPTPEPTPTPPTHTNPETNNNFEARGEALKYADARLTLVGPDGRPLPQEARELIIKSVKIEATEILTEQAEYQREGKPVDPNRIDLANILYGRAIDAITNKIGQFTKVTPVAIPT